MRLATLVTRLWNTSEWERAIESFLAEHCSKFRNFVAGEEQQHAWHDSHVQYQKLIGEQVQEALDFAASSLSDLYKELDDAINDSDTPPDAAAVGLLEMCAPCTRIP